MNEERRAMHKLWLPCLMLCLALASSAAADESSDQRFLAGLRQRGLFSLAEVYCTEQLRRDDLSDVQRVELVVELSRSLAEQAASLPPAAREPLWQRAVQVADDFATAHLQDPRLPLVRLQQALAVLARGELAQQEAELTAGQADLLDQARVHLRAAVARLGELADDVAGRLRERNLSGRAEAGALDADELVSLQRNVEYQLARALRSQALCYPPDSPDRANCLTRAASQLGPLAKLDPAAPLAWPSRVDLIVVDRLLGDREAAQRQIEALLALAPPAAIRLRVRAEQIRLALASDRLDQAVALLGEGRQIEGATSAELDYAWLETLLAASRAAREAGRAADADGWQAKATELVEQIEQWHGPYWTRRAGMLLAGYVRSGPAGGDLDIVVRAAESSYRSGQFDDALAGYDRAAAMAAQAGDPSRAFELGYVAATIEHQRGNHQQAMERYRRLATAVPKDPRAAEAHLLAIYHAAQLANDPATRPPDALDEYAALLEEHLKLWPTGPTADRVRRDTGRLFELRGDWPRAIRAYEGVSPDDANYLQAIQSVERCYVARIAQQATAGQPQLARTAADWFESLALGSQGRLPARLGPVEQFAVLAAARFRLNYLASDYDRTEKLLAAAMQAAADAPAEWTSAARVLRVVCLAGQGRRGEAGQLVAELSAGSPAELLGMLQGLERVAAAARSEVRGELAQLQLAAEKLLPADLATLTPEQRRTLAQIHAQALADAGRRDEALRAYRALADEVPRDGAIQEAYATLLVAGLDLPQSESARRQSIAAALEKWRELEARSTPQSDRWYRAKYWVARLHFESGNPERAAKIISLLAILHPELGGPELKPRFDDLLRRCQQ